MSFTEELVIGVKEDTIAPQQGTTAGSHREIFQNRLKLLELHHQIGKRFWRFIQTPPAPHNFQSIGSLDSRLRSKVCDRPFQGVRGSLQSLCSPRLRPLPGSRR